MAAVLSIAACEPATAAGPNSTILLSRPSGVGALPVPGDNSSFAGQKAMSGDGRFIVFASDADDLLIRDTLTHVWVRDTLSGTTSLVDRLPGGGAPGNGFPSPMAISRDGSTVCFGGTATNLVPGVTGLHVFVVTLATGAIVVADRAAGVGGAVGNDSGGLCALDGTGTRVMFLSQADNLVPGDTNDGVDVFVRDLAVNSTTRVSVRDDESQASGVAGFGAAISADGLKIAFVSSSGLVAGDENDASDVYVRNTQAGTTVRASMGTGSVEADGSSGLPAIDDTGRYVAFASVATNLEPGSDTAGRAHVYWRDLVSDTTILVSRATGSGALADGDSSFPAISGDGLGVAFESLATNLGAGAPPADGGRVYLRRLGTNVTSLLSRASGEAGAPADAPASGVSLGTSPTVASWTSSASNLDPAASGEFFQVFKRDLSGTPATTLVSRPTGTGPRSSTVNHSELPGPSAISADARLVVFESSADGLDPAAAGRLTHVFVRDVATDTTTLVSRGPGPDGVPADANSRSAAIAAGGTHVVFVSEATNLLPGVTGEQIYVRDLTTGALQVASRADGANGALALNVSGVLDVSADGTRVVFAAVDPLISTDDNSRRDVYVRDLVANTTTLVSVGPGGGIGDDDSLNPSMSDDGMRVAFTSRATNLRGGAPTSGEHVYVRDLLAGTTVLADRNNQDGAPGSGAVREPAISGAGNRVAFFADQPLTSDLIPGTGAVYVRDLAADTTLLVSRADGPDGVATSAAPDKATSPSLSHDGTRVGWTGTDADLPGGTDTVQVYVRDLVANTTRLVSAVDGTVGTPGNDESFAPALSADGGCVAFRSNADDLTLPAYPTRDFGQVHLRAVDGDCPVLATATTSTTLPPGSGTPLAAKTVVLRPDRLVKLSAKGLPAGSVAAVDPTRGDGTLLVSGTTGSASYTLPAAGWKAVGRRQPKGFKFKGAGCRVVLLQQRVTVTCRGDTGGLRLPEPGPLDVALIVDGKAFCAECGGRAKGRRERVFKRKDCPAPASCP